MNPKPKDNSMYKPTALEHYANFLTHGVIIK